MGQTITLANGESVTVQYTDANGNEHSVFISADPTRHEMGLTIDLPAGCDTSDGPLGEDQYTIFTT